MKFAVTFDSTFQLLATTDGTPAAAKAHPKPTILRGRYSITREISRGGMGAVYLARDLLADRDVAVKKSFFSGDPKARTGFELEAKLLARLGHPGLPKVIDYFILDNDVQVLVMDFIPGKTLEEILSSGVGRIGRGLDQRAVTKLALEILNFAVPAFLLIDRTRSCSV